MFSLLGQKFFVRFLGKLKKPKYPFEINAGFSKFPCKISIQWKLRAKVNITISTVHAPLSPPAFIFQPAFWWQNCLFKCIYLSTMSLSLALLRIPSSFFSIETISGQKPMTNKLVPEEFSMSSKQCQKNIQRIPKRFHKKSPKIPKQFLRFW